MKEGRKRKRKQGRKVRKETVGEWRGRRGGKKKGRTLSISRKERMVDNGKKGRKES